MSGDGVPLGSGLRSLNPNWLFAVAWQQNDHLVALIGMSNCTADWSPLGHQLISTNPNQQVAQRTTKTNSPDSQHQQGSNRKEQMRSGEFQARCLKPFSHIAGGLQNHMFIFEVYDNAAALDAHRQTDHFKKYAATTKEMVAKRDSDPLSSVALNIKGK